MHARTKVCGLIASPYIAEYLLLTGQPSRGDEHSADARKELLHVGRLEGPIAAKWNVEGIPQYFLIDQSGTLHSILSASEHDLVEAITPVVEQAIQAITRHTDNKSD